MNVLLLGSGGREHALAWKLAQSPRLGTLYASPGNPGIAAHAALVALDLADHTAAIAFAQAQAIGLVVIGPEAPLVDGLGDSLRAAGIAVFGPNRAAAQLEGSKAFTKALCASHGVPTAAFEAHTDPASAHAALARFGLPVVIKADGLAAGKGVVIASDRSAAEAALDAMFGSALGQAGVVIEEFLEGEEASLFVLTDGAALLPFGSAQDHKRVGDGDTGPNTGGMGAYSPAGVLTPELEAEAIERIVEPTVRALAAAGTPFSGVLYAGLMLTAEGPRLIEYNARFGDPECQALMMRFEGDLVETMLAVAEGKLASLMPQRFADAAAVTVVVAAAGYPGAPQLAGAIRGIEAAEAIGVRVFQAGTRLGANGLEADGGRILGVTATGADLAAAQRAAYAGVAALDIENSFWRKDIGARAIAATAESS